MLQKSQERKIIVKIKMCKILLLSPLMLLLAFQLRAGPPSAADVGDVDSFGKNAHYMGAASGFITLSPDCSALPSPTPTPPDNQCFTLNPAPATTTFSAENICRINLPKDSTKDIIYPVLNFFTDYQLQNSSGAPQPQAIFDYSASLTIVSAVLNDPSIIDPNTGLPANGQLIFVFYPDRFRVDRSLAVDERIRNRLDYARAGNAGITKAGLVASGLSQSVVDQLFKNPMTIRMDVTGTAKFVTEASITCNMRLFGD
jgi:hypothetical protein